MIENTPLFWIIFNITITSIILLDLKLFNPKDKEISLKKSLLMTAGWISLAILFNLSIYLTRGSDDALKFLAGYLVEYSLSVDNLFVFLLIFSYFQVPSNLVHKVLFWGILGAIIMRAIFILFGIALIQNFSWMIYVFGIFLIYTGFKLFFSFETDANPEKNIVLRIFKKIYPVSEKYVNGYFFTKIDGKWAATPLFIVLLSVETTDVIFAVDSIPAILGITTDIVLVYTSNIFAVLGLRSLYFALSSIMKLFRYLHYGLAVILVFIGIKMLLSSFIHLPIYVTLGFIFITLITSVLTSLVIKENK